MDQLIKKVKKGDQDSIDEFIRSFYDPLFCYVYKLTNEKAISLDLTQEIFIKLLNNIHTYQSGNFQSWMFTIAHNHVMSYFKSKQYKIMKNETELYDLFSYDLTTEDQIINQESYIFLSKAITDLKDKYKEVIVLKYYQDLTILEMAEHLNLNPNTIKTRLKRAIDQLKELLERDDYFE